MNGTTITKKAAQRNLTVMWAGFTGFLTLIFFVQTVIGDKYPGQSDEVWDWFIPLVFPTLTLMIGVLVAVAQLSDAGQAGVDKFYYRLTLVAVTVYFLVLIAVVFSAPLAFMTSETPAFEHLKKATKLLSALQAIVTLVLGFFFFREDKGAG